jgi:hypothetical protein
MEPDRTPDTVWGQTDMHVRKDIPTGKGRVREDTPWKLYNIQHSPHSGADYGS